MASEILRAFVIFGIALLPVCAMIAVCVEINRMFSEYEK
jgi:hypothetical protein